MVNTHDICEERYEGARNSPTFLDQERARAWQGIASVGGRGAVGTRIGETIGSCQLVWTSPSPRATETALAMGYAIDAYVDALSEMPEAFVQEIGHYERWSWEEPFQVFAQVLARGEATAQVGHRVQAAWRAAAEPLSDSGKGLLITHGRLLEVGVIACLPGSALAAFGQPFGHCEGVQLGYEAGQFHLLQLLRLASADHAPG